MRSSRGSESSRNRKTRGMQPRAESLETRQLLAVDLNFTAGPAPGPYGVGLTGVGGATNVGTSVAVVGDVNGDGYQDMVVGTPSIGSAAFIFGSRPTDYLTLSNSSRLTTLQNLVPSSSGISGFQFVDPDSTSQFGFSVAAAGDVNGDRFADFIVGAPRALNAAGTAQTGKAVLIFGSANFNNVQVAAVNITQLATAGLRGVTFTNTLSGSLTGGSVAYAGSVLQNQQGTSVPAPGTLYQASQPALAIGAPNASIGGFAANGAVYLIPNSVIVSAAGTVDLSLVGQTNGTQGVLIVGAASNSNTGTSIANAGDIDSDGVQDLLIGTPQNSLATLVYGSSSLLTRNSALTSNGTTRGILINQFGSGSTKIPGIQINGNNDLTGQGVSAAGDFNADGRADMMIGSPNFGGSGGIATNAGMATLIYGTSSRYTGSVSITALPAQLASAQFVGEGTNAYTGYSLSAAGFVNTDQYSDVLIGAPGLNNNVGRGYVIPGNPGLYGALSLVNSETNPYIESVVITSSGSGIPTGMRVGHSVSGYLRPQTFSSRTVDNDNLFDVLTGVPGLSGGGAGFLTQGFFLNQQMVTPKSNVIVTDIGVDALPTAPQPYRISATTPSTVNIFVLSVPATGTPTGQAFAPLTQIVASSIVVNGVSFPNATVSATSPADINNDGIPDALVQISPRSFLNLQNGSSNLTIAGLTNTNARWQGSASIFVVGGSNPNPNPSVNPVAPGIRNNNDYKQPYNAPVNGEAGVPNASALSRLYWKPLRYQVAYQQFVPNKYFQMRQGIALGTANPKNVQAVISARRNMYQANPVWNHKSVFTRGVTYPGIKVRPSARTVPPTI
jgi:hypothetical protein